MMIFSEQGKEYMKNNGNRVILVKTDTREVEKLVNSGWIVSHAFPHPQGALLFLKK